MCGYKKYILLYYYVRARIDEHLTCVVSEQGLPFDMPRWRQISLCQTPGFRK